ncbi:MAG TPA: carboxypeptidase-like regulatory domain-containing protein [Candidatus Sulfotelmatobacter sp.]|nr:carboxypeptidase-like regulatory domain-containing protein [Candidatus Sulfotelmatobacter sp.]
MRNSLFIFLFFTATFFSQTARAQSPAIVDGAVVNKLTGAPVKGAHVIYNKTERGAGASSPVSTDTDSQGHFSLQLPSGSYRLWVERNGFARQIYGALSPAGEGATLSLAAGQQLHELAFRITPLGAIAGHVFDEEGEPLQGVGIQVLRFSYANGHRQLISVAGASSNDRGEYRVFGLSAARYLLLASPPGAPMSRPFETGSLVAEAQDAYAALYYPGVSDVDSASLVSLPEGGEFSDVDFRLRKLRAVTVRGRVVSPLGKFLGGQVQVVLAHNERNAASYIDRASAVVDAVTGRFEIHGAAPGSYLLVASQLMGGRLLMGRAPLEVSSTTPAEEITVALVPAFDIQGAIVMEGTRGNLPNLIVRLTPSEGLTPGPQPLSKVAPDGSIRLSGVTPGLWTLTLDALPEGLWVKTATFADSEVGTGEFHVNEGTRGQIRVVLANNGARISGTVTANGQPCLATVVLAPAAPELRGSHQLYRVTNTTERGLFILKGIPPGAYRLFAFQEIAPFEWLDPEQLRLVEALGEPLSLGEGENVLRDLVVIPPDALLPPR